MKLKHYLWLSIVYVLLLLICNQALGLFRLTDASYHLNFDTSSYLEATDLLINHQIAHPTRCIAYPLILAGPYTLFRTSQSFFESVFLIQVCMLFWVFVFLFKILRNYLSHTQSMIAVLLLMLNISCMIFVFHVLTEIAFLFFITLAFYAWHLFVQKRNEKFLWIAFACSCFSVLLRPGLYYLNMAILIILLYYFINKKRAVRNAFITGAIFLCSICVQLIMMQTQYGVCKISMIDDVTMYEYMNTSVYAKLQGADKSTLMAQRNQAIGDSLRNYTALRKYPAYHDITQAETSGLLQYHTINYVSAYAENLISNFHSGNSLLRDLPQQYVYSKWLQEKLFDYTRIWNMLMVILLMVMNGVITFVLIKKRQEINHVLFFLITVLIYADYCFFTSGLSYFQGDRFNVVWMPLLFVMAIISLKVFRKSSM